MMDNYANLVYDTKIGLLDQYIDDNNYDGYIWAHERAYRFDAFDNICDVLSNEEYWQLLSKVWIDSENLWQHHDRFPSYFNAIRPKRYLLMTQKERNKLLNEFDDVVTIYRGCGPDNEDGWSWTTQLKVAEWFAKRFANDDYVITMKCNKSDILALLQSRSEDEIIIDPGKVWDI